MSAPPTTPTAAVIAGVFFRLEHARRYWHSDFKTLVEPDHPVLLRSAALTKLVGQVAQVVALEIHETQAIHFRHRVQDVALGACAWLAQCIARDSLEPLAERIQAERARQIEKYTAEHYATLSAAEWMAILTEEVGEVAQAAYRASRAEGRYTPLLDELVQVAAVAVAWLEVLEGDAS